MVHSQKELFSCLGFSCAPGVGPATFRKLYARFGSAHTAFTASKNALRPYFLSQKNLTHFLSFRTAFEADRMMNGLITNDVHVIAFSSSRYPKAFRALCDPPPCIFAKGNVNLLSSTVPILAIIGTRKPSSYGIRVTQSIIRHLASCNVFVLSGLALGIDGLAHIEALQSNIPTLSILGSGFNHIHPRSNLGLHNKIISSGGLIMSEYHPDVIPHKGTFPQRNRLIASLAHAVLVIEGNERSGTRITCTHALEYGTDIFCIPGAIDSHLTWTPHYFIQQGAYLIHSPEDIVQHMKLKKRGMEASSVSKTIIENLTHGPRSAADLAKQLQSPLHTVLSQLTTLEIEKTIKKTSENTYLLQ